MSTRKPLAPSTTKKEFLHRLGLVDGDAVSEKVHRLMMVRTIILGFAW